MAKEAFMILRSLTPSLLLACSLMATACMADLDAPDEPVESATAAVNDIPVPPPPAPMTVFHWKQSEGEKTLEPKGSHVCVLTGLRGAFKAYDDWARVSTNDTSWVLKGSSQSGVLEADATCAPRYLFQARPERGTDKVVTKQHTVAASGCQLSETFPAGGAAFTFLEGIQGKFSFDTDVAFVRQSPTLEGSNRLSASGCQPVRAFARSMRVGDPVHNALFMNRDGFIGDVTTIDETQIVASPARRYSFAWMAPAEGSLCGFTAIRGEFNGLDDAVSIVPFISPDDGLMHWVLFAGSKTGPATFAAARCYAMEQR
jgi:hypothetical protein